MNTLRTILVFIFVVFATTINIKGDGVPDDYVCKRITNKIVEIKGERNMIYFEGPYTHFETFNSQQAASERGLRLISETDAYEWKKKEEYPSFVGSLQTAKKRCSKVYDIGGRQLPKAPQRGVYIQNGKKIMLK